MKTFFKLLLPVLILYTVVNACISYIKNIPHTYTDDYPVLYADQLQIMFGSDHTIGEKKTIKVEAEDCGCGYHSDGYLYDQWDITYQDQEGYTYTQTLNNMQSLEYQQLVWLKNQLSSYYKQKYLLNRFPDDTFLDLSADEYSGKSYCFISIGSPVSSYTTDKKEEYKKAEHKGNEYHDRLLQSLQNEENMIHFYELDYCTIFETFPVSVFVKLSINDASLWGKEKEIHEEKLRKDILDLMDEWNKDTNETSNLQMYISSNNGSCDLYDGSRNWRYYMMCGKWFEPQGDGYDNYDWQLYYAYEGVFW